MSGTQGYRKFCCFLSQFLNPDVTKHWNPGKQYSGKGQFLPYALTGYASSEFVLMTPTNEMSPTSELSIDI